MIDLTNQDHRRGIVILNSKDMRVVSNNLFNWKVHTGCVSGYLDTLKNRLSKASLNDKDLNDCLGYIKGIEQWIKDASEDIDKAREIFR